MKSVIRIVVLLSLLLFAASAAAQDDVQKHPSCKYCGMDRAKFAHSRVLIQYGDGSSVGTCSLHCAAIDLALNIDKTPDSILVADYKTKTLVPVEKATWVLGGTKQGVMTKRAKWAFSGRDGAESFIKENSGQIAVFEAAMKASYEDMYDDTRMIREKRRMMKIQHQH